MVKSILKSKDIEHREINDMNEIINVAKEQGINDMPILKVDGEFYSGSKAVEYGRGL